MTRYDAVVVGAGVAGLAAARSLGRRGAGRVLLLEQFRLGHVRGGSHGTSRIFRTTYPEEAYCDLAREALAEDWPDLEEEAGQRLLHRAPAVFFGPADGPLEEYAAGVAGRAEVERVTAAEGRDRFPALALSHGDSLVDTTAAVVAAEDTLTALAAGARSAGVEIREETVVRSVSSGSGAVVLDTSGGPVEASRVVLAPGGWASRLLPASAPPVTTIRQTVAYLSLEGREVEIGEVPIWVYLGPGANGERYGLPSFGRPGMKAARHILAGRDDDPQSIGDPEWVDLEDVLAVVDREFTSPVAEVLGSETCLYAMAPGEDFLLGPLPDDDRVVVGAGLSGHGFKFGPLLGRVLADLAMGEDPGGAFASHRARFDLGR